jgi:hypothetical protein
MIQQRRSGGPSCIHVGLPKTATTMLQKHLFPGHSQIEYLGKFAQQKKKFRDAAVRTIVRNVARDRVFSPDLNHCRRLFVESIAPAFRKGKRPVLSSEAFTVGGLPRRQARAENLRGVFGDCKVIITLRHPLRFVESMYFQKLKEAHVGMSWHLGKAPRHFSIEQWLDDVWRLPEKGALSHLEYAQTMDVFADVFGKDAMGVFLFEQLVEDPHATVGRLCRFIGVDVEQGVRLSQGKRENERWTVTQVERLKLIQRSFWRSLAFRCGTGRVRRKLLGLDPRTRSDAAPKARAELAAPWRERIVELVREGNRRLASEWGLPLEHYGYPL